MRHGICGINVTYLRLNESGRAMKAKTLPPVKAAAHLFKRCWVSMRMAGLRGLRGYALGAIR